ncbi:MAG: hypothetical protein KKD44_04075 [Proteobacteria bacterium]|nr:hypothetical protein [Pseudomonadota bacterium]
MEKKNCKIYKWLYFLCVSIVFITLGCGQSSDDRTGNITGGITTEDDKSNHEVLSDLGFDVNTTSSHDDVSNPLGGKITKFKPNFEIYLEGAKLSGLTSMAGLIEDPYDSSFDLLNEYSNGAGMSLPKKSVAADIDGDGYDEIVTAIFSIASKTIQLSIKDINDDVTETHNFQNQDFITHMNLPRGESYSYYFMRDLTAGDFNNDGKSEIVLSSYNTVLFFNDELTEITGSFTDLDNVLYARVEAGNLDGDTYCDLVLTAGKPAGQTGMYYIFSGSAEGLGIKPNDDPLDYAVVTGSLFDFSSAEPIIADLDGDKLNEIIFGGTKKNNVDILQLTIIDPWMEKDDKFLCTILVDSYVVSEIAPWCAGRHEPSNYFIPRMVAGDFNNDSRSEFGIMDKFYSYDNKTLTRFTEGVFNTGYENYRHSNMFHDVSVAGDVTGDGIDDLVFLIAEDLSDSFDLTKCNFTYLKVWGQDNLGVYKQLSTIPIAANKTYPTLALANVDNDSTTLKYISKQLEFGTPKILAILASPPYNDAIDISGSNTSFKLTSGTEEGWEFSNGFNVGVAIGASADVEMPFCNILSLGGGRSVSLEQEFTWGYGETKSQSLSYEETCNAGNDMVFVTAVPLDVYVYEILSSPDEGSIGKNITINIPKTLEYLFISVDLYNSLVSENDQIPSEILNHTIGDPNSYYRTEDRDIFISDGEGFIFQGAKVPQGNGLTTIEYEVDQDSFTQYNYSLTVNESNNIRLFMADIDYSGGYSHGYSCQSSVSSGFTLSGSVGSIVDSALWAENAFSWGLMLIPKHFNDQYFNMVTYWVNTK